MLALQGFASYNCRRALCTVRYVFNALWHISLCICLLHKVFISLFESQCIIFIYTCQVLIPVFALGRAQELCILLETYWDRMNLKVPIYFSAGLTEKVQFYCAKCY